MTPVPKVALVGRPNVGKSTLFNRICGRRKAITDSRPGSTRDRNYAQASWRGRFFELIDTGGLLQATEDPLLGPAAEHARRAIEEADLVLFLVDARAGLLPDDEAIARSLRRAGRRVLLVANKSEGGADPSEFSRLGFDQAIAVSAEHGQSVGDLLDAALDRLPRVEAVAEAAPALRIALVGRPNTGKSSLLNRLIGRERALVSELPGTTRDSVDSLLVRKGRPYLLVDTAGMRRVRLLKDNVDHVAVVQARHALERADVAVLVLDASEGVREMDAVIGGYAQKAGRGVVIAVNKWDLSLSLSLPKRAFEQGVRDSLKFLAYAPVAFLSAKTGHGIASLFSEVERVGRAFRHRVSTGELNRLLARATAAHAPKAAKGGAAVRILYGTQVGTAPPTFVLSVSHPGDLHFSYKRYLENQLRSEFGFPGVPLVLKVRTRRH